LGLLGLIWKEGRAIITRLMESKSFIDYMLKTAGADFITKTRSQNKIKHYNVVFELPQIGSKSLESFEELWPYSTVNINNKGAVIEFLVRPEETEEFIKAINMYISDQMKKVG
jgi:hypothetical protein